VKDAAKDAGVFGDPERRAAEMRNECLAGGLVDATFQFREKNRYFSFLFLEKKTRFSFGGFSRFFFAQQMIYGCRHRQIISITKQKDVRFFFAICAITAPLSTFPGRKTPPGCPYKWVSMAGVMVYSRVWGFIVECDGV
jgi:hypothetical protein